MAKREPVRTVASYDLITLSDVKEEEVKWLWEPYVPFGKLTVFEGDPETGKSYLSLRLAAMMTTGKRFYGCRCTDIKSGYDPENILILTSEDGVADTIVKRVRLLGGDAGRIKQLRGVRLTKAQDETEEIYKSITIRMAGALNSVICRYKIKLLIVDPLQAFLGENVDMHRTNEVRPILAELGKVAEKNDCAVIIIRHLRKNLDGKAAYRGMGSIDITAAARSVLLTAKDPRGEVGTKMFDNVKNPKSRFVLAQTKCSVAQKGPCIGYSIGENGLTVDAIADIDVDDLLRSEVFRQEDDAESWLLEQLSPAGKKVPHKELLTNGAVKGFSNRQLNRYANKLGVIKKPGGFGGGWEWSLPTSDETKTKPILAQTIIH